MENQVSSSSSIALHHISRPQHKTGTSESLSESFPKKVGKNANPYKSLKLSKSSGRIHTYMSDVTRSEIVNFEDHHDRRRA